jgi:class 3 adenylate cyclase
MRDANGDGSGGLRPWEEAEGFREMLAICLADDEERRTVRRFGALLFRLLLERSSPAAPTDGLGGSVIEAELAAVREELRHLAAFLAAVGRGWRDDELGASDAQLSKFAARLARRVRRLAEEVEERLGQGLRMGEPGR